MSKKIWFRRSAGISAVDLFYIRWYESRKLSSAINLKDDTDAILRDYRFTQTESIGIYHGMEKNHLGKVFAHICSYVPEEFILVSGALTFRPMETKNAFGWADAHLQDIVKHR